MLLHEALMQLQMIPKDFKELPVVQPVQLATRKQSPQIENCQSVKARRSRRWMVSQPLRTNNVKPNAQWISSAWISSARWTVVRFDDLLSKQNAFSTHTVRAIYIHWLDIEPNDNLLRNPPWGSVDKINGYWVAHHYVNMHLVCFWYLSERPANGECTDIEATNHQQENGITELFARIDHLPL